VPLQTFWGIFALPTLVFGPINFSYGLYFQISSAWRACHSGVQLFAILFFLRIRFSALDFLLCVGCYRHAW